MTRFYRVWLSLFVLTCLTQVQLFAQGRLADSSLNVLMVSPGLAVQSPAGDLADRFGNNGFVGLQVTEKFHSNWTLGLHGGILFGESVREPNVFGDIKTENGFLLSRGGIYSDIRLHETGWQLEFRGGRRLNLLARNPNSGMLLTAGAGILEHKIKIIDVENNTPQLRGDMKKGYDRLTNGLSLTLSAGYLWLSDMSGINFNLAFDFTYAATQSRRDFNFADRKRDDRQRNDLLYGLRLSWILPLYQKAPDKYYYY